MAPQIRGNGWRCTKSTVSIAEICALQRYGALSPKSRVRKEGSFGKGVFSESPFSRDSREFGDSRDSREPPDCGNKGDSDHFLEILENLEISRDSRDFSSEKTPFAMTPSSGPENRFEKH